MDLGRAITYIFDDRDWPIKLIGIFFLTFLATLLSPLLIGLLLFAVLFGYEVELVERWRDNKPPLPAWNRIVPFFERGLPVLALFIVYNLPNLLLGCMFSFLWPSLSEPISGAASAILMLCCLLPVLAIYNLFAQPMMALAIGRYSDIGLNEVLFEFGYHLTLVRSNLLISAQYVIVSLIVTGILSLIGLIPCLGQVVALALLLPIQGGLLAQFADAVLGKPGVRAANASPQPPPPQPRPRPRPTR